MKKAPKLQLMLLARFARNVVKWDFLSDFQTLCYAVMPKVCWNLAVFLNCSKIGSALQTPFGLNFLLEKKSFCLLVGRAQARAFHLKNFLSAIARRDLFTVFWVPEAPPKSWARLRQAHASARPLKFWPRSTGGRKSKVGILVWN